jgi:cytochrome c556
MLRKCVKVALAGAFGLLAVLLSQTADVRAQDKDKEKKELTTKQIMGIGHKGADQLFGKIQKAVKDKKWDDAAAPAKELAENGSLFPKATPPRDDKKTWEKLAGAYADNTKALAEAVEKKDEDKFKKASGAIQGSCKACHDNHKGK